MFTTILPKLAPITGLHLSRIRTIKRMLPALISIIIFHPKEAKHSKGHVKERRIWMEEIQGKEGLRNLCLIQTFRSFKTSIQVRALQPGREVPLDAVRRWQIKNKLEDLNWMGKMMQYCLKFLHPRFLERKTLGKARMPKESEKGRNSWFRGAK